MRRLAVVLVLALALGAGRAALGQWSNAQFTYVAVGQDIGQLLRDFAASEGLGVVVSPNVTGTVSGNFQLPPEAFLNEIAATSGLVWYRFGGVLYVYDSSEMQTQVIYLSNTPPELLQRSLAALGILDQRFGWQADADLGIVLLTGPPQYTALVRQVVETVEARRAATPGVVVIRLEHASAIDRQLSYRDEVITVPGVASILRQLVGQGQGGVQRQQLPASVPALPGLRGQGLAAQGTTPAPAAGAQPGAAAPVAPGQAPALADPLGSDLVTIESDPRLNAVIISAPSDRLPFFERLVQQLDTASQLIQIDVTIIDVATSRITELAVEWQFSGGDVALGTTSVLAPTIGAGGRITGLLGGGSSEFAFDIRALETVGDARIVSQPSVLTFDSVEAVIDETESIYVRVPGDQDVDLFEVQTGTLLRVTPRIVDNGDGRDIELFVDIRDGDFNQDMEVDDIPSVDESTLTTTAIVGEDQGLVLGGLYRTLSQDIDEKVPVLGDIPVLGLAFRSKRTQQTSVVRLFLLTPRIIQLGGPSSERIDLAPRPSQYPLPSPAKPTARGASRPPLVRVAGEPLPLLPAEGTPAPGRPTSDCDPAAHVATPKELTYRSAARRIGCRPAPSSRSGRPRATGSTGLY